MTDPQCFLNLNIFLEHTCIQPLLLSIVCINVKYVYVAGKVKTDLWIEKVDSYIFGDSYSREHPLSDATNRSFLPALVFFS